MNNTLKIQNKLIKINTLTYSTISRRQQKKNSDLIILIVTELQAFIKPLFTCLWVVWESPNSFISFPALLVVLPTLLPIQSGQDGSSRMDTSPTWALSLFLGRLSFQQQPVPPSIGMRHVLPLPLRIHTLFSPIILVLQKWGVKGEEMVHRQRTVRAFMEKDVVPEFSMQELRKQ